MNNKEDEYSNLMSLRERQWIVNIQLNQLKCENPFLDDYYYTVFNQKQKIPDSKNVKNMLKSEKEDSDIGESAQDGRYRIFYKNTKNFLYHIYKINSHSVYLFIFCSIIETKIKTNLSKKKQFLPLHQNRRLNVPMKEHNFYCQQNPNYLIMHLVLTLVIQVCNSILII